MVRCLKLILENGHGQSLCQNVNALDQKIKEEYPYYVP